MDDADGGGKTLGERVRALETNAGDAPTRDGTETSEKARSARGGEALNPSADDAAALAVAEALNGTKGAPPKADSLAVLLSQALVAEDRALIERCLSVSDPTVVDNTTSRPRLTRRRGCWARRWIACEPNPRAGNNSRGGCAR